VGFDGGGCPEGGKRATELIPEEWTSHLISTRFSAGLDKTHEHLDEREVRFKLFYGLDHEVSGICHTLHPYDLDDHATHRHLLPKTINIHLSHYMLWAALNVLSETPYTGHLIMEQDVRFEEDWAESLGAVLEFLPDDWDLLYLGSCNCRHFAGPDSLLGGGLYSVPSASCLHAYVVRGKALPVLLERCERVWAPIDLSMHQDRSRRGTRALNSYAVFPRLATQLDTRIPE